jgi:DNA-binding MurR/RpiR family transcriptional regulator
VNDAVAQLFAGARLTPTQRRIAHCLIEQSPRAGYLSGGEVAALAGVSQPSVTRFAMALGFDGYPALRRHLRDLGDLRGAPAGGAGGGHTDGTGGGGAGDAGRNEFQRAIAAEAESLSRLADRLADRTALDEAAKLLAGSRPLPVLGLRAAAPLAAYFGYFAAKIHPDVRILDQGGSLLADRLEQARASGARAMLAVVLPRYPGEVLHALREARGCGLSVVVLTDSPVSPAAAHADHVLAAPVGSQLVFDLQAAPMALAMVLLQAICDAAPGEAQARLEEFEHSAARRGVFVA